MKGVLQRNARGAPAGNDKLYLSYYRSDSAEWHTNCLNFRKRKNYQTFQYPRVLMQAPDQLDRLLVLLVNLEEADSSREGTKGTSHFGRILRAKEK
jgi:hypothetical protein